MIKVYIASPYTKGDVSENVRLQMTTMNTLIEEGYSPFCPLLFHFQDLMFPQAYNKWIALSADWVLSCDVLLRLEGESAGADGEVRLTTENNIPVVFSLTELYSMYEPT